MLMKNLKLFMLAIFLFLTEKSYSWPFTSKECSISTYIQSGLFEPYISNVFMMLARKKPHLDDGDFVTVNSWSAFNHCTMSFYAPDVFNDIRSRLGYTDRIFSRTLFGHLFENSNAVGSESEHFMSENTNLILKSIRSDEFKNFMEEILLNYYRNFIQNPDSLLVKIYGLLTHSCGNCNENRLLITENVLPAKKPVHELFDLKGAFVGRMASEEERMKEQPTLMDQDYMHMHPNGFSIAVSAYNRVTSALETDFRTMANLELTDYSFVLGVQYTNRLMPYDPMDTLENGIPAIDERGKFVKLYFGVIDILTKFTAFRNLEHGYKKFLNGDDITLQKPATYAVRLYNFIRSDVFHPMNKFLIKSANSYPMTKPGMDSMQPISAPVLYEQHPGISVPPTRPYRANSYPPSVHSMQPIMSQHPGIHVQ